MPDRDASRAEQAATDERTRWGPEFLILGQRRIRGQVRILGLSVVVGIVAGLAAIVFYVATEAATYYAMDVVAGYRPEPHPGGEIKFSWMPPATRPLTPWLLVLVPTVGGLISGWIIYTFAPEAEGHGTDSAIAAYHQHQGYMRPRVPIVKIIASALTIGSGGSGGREGPIAQIGAGFGSVLADLLRLRPAERRVLLAAGMGAGIGAVFRAPVAGALFAAEVLYRSPEFEPEVILPAALASVIAYSTFGAMFGWAPLFSIPALTFADPRQLLAYTALALAMVPLAMLYTRTFYGLIAVFRRMPGPRHIRPAVGAAATGLLAVGMFYLFGQNPRALAVLSFGYGGVQGALSETAAMGGWLLLAIALGKILTTSLTIGSGGSGGVFGPSMVIGACAGGALGVALNHLWPALVPEPSAFAVVGMAGFFAAAAKTPFSTLIIVSEITGGYLLLLPALWVCTIAFMLSDRQSIYSQQVESRTRSPAHQGSFVRQALAGVTVAKFVTSDKRLLHPGDSLGEVLNRFDEAVGGVVPVVDEEHRLLGIVDLEEVYLASHTPELRPLVVAADLMRSQVTPLVPQDSLQRAYELFVENELQALPVVGDRHERRVLGLVRRSDVASAYLRLLYGPSHPGETPGAAGAAGR